MCMNSLSNNRFEQVEKMYDTLSRFALTNEEKETDQNKNNKIASIMSKPNCQRTKEAINLFAELGKFKRLIISRLIHIHVF